MSQDNIFREVDEELRSDRMQALWRRFAPFVIGGAVAIVLLVAINEGWGWYTNSRSAQSSQELYAALDTAEAGDLTAAQTQLDAIIANGSGGYPVLAQFRAAALLAQEGDNAGAVSAYDALANNQSNPRLRELALLLAASILVDNGTLSDVEARIGTLATEESQMRRPARELLGLAQYKDGNPAAAQQSFEAVLNDPFVPSPMRSRISFYLAQMLSEGTVAAITPAEAAAESIDAIVSDEATTPAPAEPVAE